MMCRATTTKVFCPREGLSCGVESRELDCAYRLMIGQQEVDYGFVPFRQNREI